MLKIVKRNAPQSLIAHACNSNSSYDNYKDKANLRKFLVKEQGGLCAYCMGRISASRSKMKIEHWHCQGLFPDEQLKFSNLLGCCLGAEGAFPSEQHCDTHKGNSALHYNPADPFHHNVIEKQIKYLRNGAIESQNSDLNSDIAVLNLNTPRLVSNRHAVIKSIVKILSCKFSSASKSTIRHLISGWSSEEADGNLREYAGVAIYYLSKKLSSM